MTALAVAGLIWFVVITYVTQARLWLGNQQITPDEHNDREAVARADFARFEQEKLDDAAMRSGRR